MATIRRYPFVSHLRSEASRHVLAHRQGKAWRAGRGLAFFFWPEATSIAEVPMDDRDQPFVFHGKSRDFQSVSVQGVVTWRVADPEVLAGRVDFTIDAATGLYLGQPLDQVADLLTGLAQQTALSHLLAHDVIALLTAGPEPLEERLRGALIGAERLARMGVAVETVRVIDLTPAKDLQRALQTPTFEKLQQQADQATFERRALAVEKERAIAENELQNQVELERRRAQLIEQEAQNAGRQAESAAEARRIETAAEASNITALAEAEAGRVRAMGAAEAEREQARMAIYRELPAHVLSGLALQRLAETLQRVDRITLTPDVVSEFFARLGDQPPGKGG